MSFNLFFRAEAPTQDMPAIDSDQVFERPKMAGLVYEGDGSALMVPLVAAEDDDLFDTVSDPAVLDG